MTNIVLYQMFEKVTKLSHVDILQTQSQRVTALFMTYILDMTERKKEVAGITTGLFRLIKLLAATSSVMTKPPWRWVFQGVSESD